MMNGCESSAVRHEVEHQFLYATTIKVGLTIGEVRHTASAIASWAQPTHLAWDPKKLLVGVLYVRFMARCV